MTVSSISTDTLRFLKLMDRAKVIQGPDLVKSGVSSFFARLFKGNA